MDAFELKVLNDDTETRRRGEMHSIIDHSLANCIVREGDGSSGGRKQLEGQRPYRLDGRV